MFYHIEGTLTELEPNLAAVDCGGIGFALNITMNTASQLSVGQRAKFYVSEAVSENNFDLYGFSSKSEKRCYELLTSVSGVGPKAALSILSYSTPDSLALAIMNNDEKALTVAPGVGKKIAQRVILELRDKISGSFGTSAAGLPVHTAHAAQGTNVGDAMAALGVLGYSSAEIAPVLKELDTAVMSAEQIIKAVLKQMVKQ